MTIAPGSAYAEWLLDAQSIARLLDAYAAALGSAAPLLAELGLRPPLEALTPLARARLSGRAVGLLANRQRSDQRQRLLRPVHWRIIRYALYGGRTLRDAIARCSDAFEAIDGRCGRMALLVAGDRASVQLDALRDREDAATALVDLYAIANVYALLVSLIAAPLPLAAVSLAHDAALVDALGLPPPPFPLQLAAGWTGLSFPAAYLDHPVVRTVDEASAETTLGFLLPTLEAESEQLTMRVRRIALQSLRETGRLPPFERIVTLVGGSAATLRRRLAAAGMTYRAIKDSCRRELALTLLAQPHGTIEELAGQLDFCDSDAFRRAFRAWFGMAPSEFRAQAAERA